MFVLNPKMEIIQQHIDQINSLCFSNKVKKLFAFGSANFPASRHSVKANKKVQSVNFVKKRILRLACFKSIKFGQIATY